MYYYILNPAAGRGSVNTIQDKLRSKLTTLGVAGEFVKTTGSGDATKITRAAIDKGYTTIVAVGGDGTVNEVINGITRDNVAIGIIPIGKTNSLARRLGITGWQSALPILANRRLTSFGLMAAGQQFFLSTLTLGFATDLDKTVDTQEQGLRPRLKQFAQGWGRAQNFQPLACQIKADDKFQLDTQIFTLSVSNQKFYNPLAPNKLIVNISSQPSRIQLTGLLWSLIRRETGREDVATTRFLADRVLIDTQPSTGIMIDGKVAGRTPIAVRLTDRRIRFISAKPAREL
jgi:diacylglycerol kinase family enzyme